MLEQNGSPESAAFDRLYRQHGSPVRNFLLVLLGDPSTADDLTQETFLHL
ncbi:MAG TPA: sigma factor [Bryobacteraceae bacterium]|nr:sigma factor [Bryobacteraceae bacterium]